MVTACKISRGHNRETDRHADGEIKGGKKKDIDGPMDRQMDRHTDIYIHM